MGGKEGDAVRDLVVGEAVGDRVVGEAVGGGDVSVVDDCVGKKVIGSPIVQLT